MKKNIIIISTEFPPAPGGIGSHAYAVACHLNNIGWNVTVLSEQNNADNEEISEFNNLQAFKIIRLLPTPSVKLLILKMLLILRIVKKSSANFIIGTGKHGCWFAFVISKILFRTCLLIGHGTEFTETMSKRSRNINKFIYSKAEKLVCVSEYTMQVARSIGIVNKNSMVIHNGAEDSVFYKLGSKIISEFKKEKGLNKTFNIVTVGNISKRKGQEWIIKALPSVINQFPNVNYYCIGLPSIKDELEELSIKLGVRNNVHFLGKLKVEEVRLWLNSCDLFAMTSANNYGDFEGFGIAVIEAALCGLPAIVTNQSGVYESIIEHVTGVGVPEKDEVATANAILKLISNKELLSSLAANATERAKDNFTWQKIITQYDRILKKV